MALTTASGKPLHPLGIGTWDIASDYSLDYPEGEYRHVQPVYGREQTEVAAIMHSISRGQNHIDTAELYGAFYTDEVVGAAITAANVDLGVERSDLFIADKLWKNSVQPGAVRPVVEQMLSKLKTDYIDLLYIHAPWPDVEWQSAIAQIDQLIDEKVVRYFGVSNFSVAQMQLVLRESRHALAANQMNFSCDYQDEANSDFRTFCTSQDIAIVAYQPLQRGVTLKNAAVGEIAARHGVTPAQVALAWLIEVGALPIPKSIEANHIDENLGSLDVVLTSQDMTALG